MSVLRPEPDGVHFLPGPDLGLWPDDVLVVIGRENDLLRIQEGGEAPAR
jgi:K+/H+ antiporter YhaU regulatory subunit KhtT